MRMHAGTRRTGAAAVAVGCTLALLASPIADIPGTATAATAAKSCKPLSLNRSSAKLAETSPNVKRIVYGTSVQGRTLEAYAVAKAGKYGKTLFMDFAIHGFEDVYRRDGKVLTREANKLIAYFAKHPGQLRGWRLVIVPCANPDGTIAGKNNWRAQRGAFGRCTAKHVDMNRDFGRFRGRETRALRDVIKRSHPRVYLNMHGWIDQTLGTTKLNGIVDRALGLGIRKNGVYAAYAGYAHGWVHEHLKIPATLVEYKSPKSVSTKKDVKMIRRICKAYGAKGKSR